MKKITADDVTEQVLSPKFFYLQHYKSGMLRFKNSLFETQTGVIKIERI